MGLWGLSRPAAGRGACTEFADVRYEVSQLGTNPSLRISVLVGSDTDIALWEAPNPVPGFLIMQVDSWWDILLPKVFPFLYSEGGPIIMVQVNRSIKFVHRVTVFCPKKEDDVAL